MKNLDYSKIENKIISFLIENVNKSKTKGYVIGISGGIDSAVVSTLIAKTGLNLYLLQMPIRQKSDEIARAQKHINWLLEKYPNAIEINCDLTPVFDLFVKSVKKEPNAEIQHLAEANTRSRLRMTTLYYYASITKCLVAGTGNKIEDFGIGFFTKYGDGGVDVSPIGDLMKSEVRQLGRFMGVSEEIVDAKPTDGLWDDGRGDEDQVGASYDELEWAMRYFEKSNTTNYFPKTNDREKEILEIYVQRHNANLHKMLPIPVCKIDNN